MIRPALFLSLFITFFLTGFAQVPSNDDCTSPETLALGSSCSPVGGNLYMANVGTPTSSCGTAYDVWYAMTTPKSVESVTITVNATGNLIASKTFFAVYTGSACQPTLFTGTTCTAAGTSLVLSTVSPSTTYYVRVFTTADPGGNNASLTKCTFNICASYTGPPDNDECSGASTLTMGTGSNGTVWKASASAGIPVGCASGTPDDDVWYKFTATASNVSLTLSGVGSDLAASGAMMQLFSGSCNALTSIACAGTSTLYATGLTVGTTYYVRVYSAGAGDIGTAAAGSAFTITASVPPALTSGNVQGGRMSEVFQQTILSPAGTLYDPWEITYGPDGYLWITEAKGYKLYRMDPSNGAKVTVLDISQNSTFLPSADRSFNVQFSTNASALQSPWPQGGFAGMAIHPKFLDPVAPKNYIYVSYVHSYVKTVTSPANGGIFFTNRVVRFTYNTATGKLESPVSLCDTLPGSSDHNSQRMIIAPVNGTDYLFYAAGDMGAGQFDNTNRENKAQNTASYEGKILRFNLEDDNDAGTLDKWIPNDNPFNGTTQSAVWSTGIRNNQGFAYAKINGTDFLYGSSHGPFSDDEINVIEKAKNYGHPIVIGFNDGNYDNAKAGPAASSLPLITSEATNVSSVIGTATYRDPIFSFYPAPKGNTTTAGTIQYIYNQVNTGNNANASWPSEAPSGLDVYTNSSIPGWKNSLLAASLKGGKIIRLKLNASGSISSSNDTVSYFRSVNRFRDVALSPDGKSVFAIIDKSSTTSGPTNGNPMVSACAGCVIKYTFMGYSTVNSRSSISSSVDVSTGTANNCTAASTTTIDATNNNLWVPITGSDGNIVAEINANGNNLGTVTTSFYSNSGSVRENASKRLYADRNITITPQTQPSSAVSIRLYLTSAELNALKTATNSNGKSSGVSSIADVAIYKNSDACGSAMTATTTLVTPTIREAFGGNYVLQADISSFSSFYFANPSMVLSLQLLQFKGAVQNNAVVLNWETVNEMQTAYFAVERSLDGIAFTGIGKVSAAGYSSDKKAYGYTDAEFRQLPTPTTYYRLKMMNADGSFTYSNVVSFANTTPASVFVFPNPVRQKLTVSFSQFGFPVTLQITDLSGRVLYTEKKWHAVSEVDVSRWKPQVYLLKVIDGGNKLVATEKFEKIN